MGAKGNVISYRPTPVMTAMVMIVVVMVVTIMIMMILFHPRIFMMIHDVMFMMTRAITVG